MGVRLQWIKQAPNPHPNPSPTGKGFEVREWAIFLLLVLKVERGDVCTKTPLLVAKPQAKLPLSFLCLGLWSKRSKRSKARFNLRCPSTGQIASHTATKTIDGGFYTNVTACSV